MPKLRASHATQETLPKLCAVADVLLTTLDALAEKGHEVDDRPRAFATVLLRWASDEASASELAVAARALEAIDWRAQPPEARATPSGQALHAANGLRSWRAQCMKFPTHTAQAIPRCAEMIVAVWRALGEPEDAARARVANLYADRFRARTGRDPDVSPLDPAAMAGVVRFAHMARFSN